MVNENPFKGSEYPYGSRKRITPEGEPLEGSGGSRSLVKIVVPIIVDIIIIAVMAISSTSKRTSQITPINTSLKNMMSIVVWN